MKKKRIKGIKLNKKMISQVGLETYGGKQALTNQFKCTNSQYLCGPRQTDIYGDCYTIYSECITELPICMTVKC